MEAITFPQKNIDLGKDQPEYQTLPVYYGENDHGKPMTCCFKLTPEEIKEINASGVIWHTQLTFGNQFHPILMSTQSPFK